MNVNDFTSLNNNLLDENQLFVEKVHIRTKKRNGRKFTTTVEGLENDLDIKKITKALKKIFKCNGSVEKDENENEIIQLSGQQSQNVYEFLIDQKIIDKENIVIH